MILYLKKYALYLKFFLIMGWVLWICKSKRFKRTLYRRCQYIFGKTWMDLWELHLQLLWNKLWHDLAQLAPTHIRNGSFVFVAENLFVLIFYYIFATPSTFKIKTVFLQSFWQDTIEGLVNFVLKKWYLVHFKSTLLT